MNFLTFPFVFVTRYFKACIFFLVLFFLLFTFAFHPSKPAPNLAKIYLVGPIIDSQSIYNQIKKIRQTPSIQGALLIINSPGGSVAASVEISDMIKSLSLEMPVVAYVQGVMASGSYYGGLYANEIVANRGSLIGSIGVIFSGLNIEELMSKFGVSSQVIAAGEYKEIGTFTRKWQENEKEFLQSLIREEYRMFVEDVAMARGLDPANYKDFAEGKVFTARAAKELGLIDKVDTQDHAIELLGEMSGVKDPIWLEKPKWESLFDSFSQSLFKSAFEVFGGMLR